MGEEKKERKIYISWDFQNGPTSVTTTYIHAQSRNKNKNYFLDYDRAVAALYNITEH